MSNRIKLTLIAIVSTITVALGLLAAVAPAGAAPAGLTTHTGTAKTGHIGAGVVVHPRTSSKPFVPTAAQVKQREADMKKLDNLPAAPIGPHPSARNIPKIAGPQTEVTKPNLPSTFTIFKDSTIPNACATDCAQSSVNEPDTVQAGTTIFQTSNWNVAFSTNNGGTWNYQDPYSFNSGFCCDQTTVYSPSRNRVFREALVFGAGSAQGVDISVANPASLGSVCTYHISGGIVGGTDGDLLDFPKLAFSNNDVYLTWNEYNAAGTAWLFSGLMRLSLDAMAGCNGTGFSFLTRNDNFTFGMPTGDSALDQLNFVSNWYTAGAGSGTNERIFTWNENSNSYSFVDPAVSAYTFSGGNCGSPDGTITNWCTRLDPRFETVSYTHQLYSGAQLVVAITAGPGGGDPYPYIIYEHFNATTKNFVSTGATFNDSFAFAYGACSPDAHGALGCVASYGGGSADFFPAGIIILQDDVSPNQPWNYSFNLTGAGNATEWGDYMYTQPVEPFEGAFVTTEWLVNGSGVVVPHVVTFGRARDLAGYNLFH